MEVLLWLVPAGIATVLAMGWAGWTGRQTRRLAEDEHHRVSPRADEAARARLGAALSKSTPAGSRSVVRQPVERGGGVAIRRP